VVPEASEGLHLNLRQLVHRLCGDFIKGLAEDLPEHLQTNAIKGRDLSQLAHIEVKLLLGGSKLDKVILGSVDSDLRFKESGDGLLELLQLQDASFDNIDAGAPAQQSQQPLVLGCPGAHDVQPVAEVLPELKPLGMQRGVVSGDALSFVLMRRWLIFTAHETVKWLLLVIWTVSFDTDENDFVASIAGTQWLGIDSTCHLIEACGRGLHVLGLGARFFFFHPALFNYYNLL